MPFVPTVLPGVSLSIAGRLLQTGCSTGNAVTLAVLVPEGKLPTAPIISALSTRIQESRWRGGNE
jgi:hypothetical protein